MSLPWPPPPSSLFTFCVCQNIILRCTVKQSSNVVKCRQSRVKCASKSCQTSVKALSKPCQRAVKQSRSFDTYLSNMRQITLLVSSSHLKPPQIKRSNLLSLPFRGRSLPSFPSLTGLTETSPLYPWSRWQHTHCIRRFFILFDLFLCSFSSFSSSH